MIKDKKYAMCILCCHHNLQIKSLPCLCPQTGMPCLAINQKWTEESNLLIFIIGLDSEECNRSITDNEEPRVPMESKYINQDFIRQMINVYDCNK